MSKVLRLKRYYLAGGCPVELKLEVDLAEAINQGLAPDDMVEFLLQHAEDTLRQEYGVLDHTYEHVGDNADDDDDIEGFTI